MKEALFNFFIATKTVPQMELYKKERGIHMFEKLKDPEWRKQKANQAKEVAKKIGKTTLELVPWLVTGLTIYEAWSGGIQSAKNEYEINKMKGQIDRMGECISHNAHVGNMDHAVLVELTKDNEELLNRALGITEGAEKETEEKEEESVA